MNVFLKTDAIEIATRIAAVRILPDGRIAIAAEENNVRPSGGGQPQDYGTIGTVSGAAPLGKVFKEAGETWLIVDAPGAAALAPGDPITLNVDWTRRRYLSRAHSLTHLGMAAIREHVEGYESKGADIGEDASLIELRFRALAGVDEPLLRAIDRRTRSLIAKALPISIERVKSVAHAEAFFPKWRMDPDLALSGRIRVVNIENIDCNPCSGSHVKDTSEIGPYALVGHRVDGTGIHIVTLRRQDAWTYWY